MVVLKAYLSLFLLALVSVMPISPTKVFPCSSTVYCQGELLRQVQEAHLWEDSKHFVDMSLQVDPEEAVRRFQELGPTPSREQIETFVNDTFLPPGSELQQWDPPDFVPQPDFLADVKDPAYREFGRELCGIWKDLGRKMREEVRMQPQRYSLLYTPHPVIVPGGRFREFYYWDSYWVVLGLLRCQMKETVKGMLLNFLHQVQTLGFVPNGGRIYFEGRSQPPLLSAMVEAYFRESRDLDFLRQQLPLLEAEYNFWPANRSVEVTVGGSTHSLAGFATLTNTPRPESFTEDVATAAGLSPGEKEQLYVHLTSGAESGWDYSSRWFRGANLSSIETADIVPVDLNSVLCMNERLLSEFYSATGNTTKAAVFQAAFQKRRQAIRDVFWDEEKGAWFDWHLPSNRRRASFYPSGLWPLATGCAHDDVPSDRVLDFLQEGGWLDHAGGLPTSLKDTGQQWDFPNAWPPLQHMAVEAFRKAGTPRMRTAALALAQNWTRANWLGFRQTGHMFEKYDVQEPGRRGGGGEYGVQLGFGWSNGVILDFLQQYGDVLSSQGPPGSHLGAASTITSPVTSLLLLLATLACLAKLLRHADLL